MSEPVVTKSQMRIRVNKVLEEWPTVFGARYTETVSRKSTIDPLKSVDMARRRRRKKKGTTHRLHLRPMRRPRRGSRRHGDRSVDSSEEDEEHSNESKSEHDSDEDDHRSRSRSRSTEPTDRSRRQTGKSGHDKHKKRRRRRKRSMAPPSNGDEQNSNTTPESVTTVFMLRRSVTHLSKILKEEMLAYLNEIDTYLFDCDGVLWISKDVISGSPEVVNKLKDLGKRVLFVTNNSTKLRENLMEKATKMKYHIKKEEILSSSYLAAMYLKQENFSKKVYVVGPLALIQELDLLGIKHTGCGPDVLEHLSTSITSFKPDPDIGAVIVGFDEFFSYNKLLKAATYLKDPNCLFLATNADERKPTNLNIVLPGAGCFLRAVETCAKRKAVLIGKPNCFVSDILVQNYEVEPKKTVIIGDRCNTDIALGNRCGFKTMLVLSGGTTLDEIEFYKKSSNKDQMEEYLPDVYLNVLGDLLPFL